ncbi:MAG: extracellular solute-binding protein [Spirochaetaceae bacterium]|nr:MAG: extracellular solute-binding protein [Spirochaetaceae bacterium]
MKKIVLVSILILALSTHFVLAEGQEESSVPTGPVTLRILWWGGQARHDKTLKVLDMYQQSNPDVKIEPTYLGWGEYWDKIAVYAAAGDLPDIFQNVINRFPQLDEKNLMADLSAIQSFSTAGIDDTAVSIGKIGGRLVGINLGVNALTMGYNDGIFDQAGVAYPGLKWTWDDMRAASVKIKNAAGVYGVDGLGTDNDMLYYLRTQGAEWFSADLKGPGWSNDKIMVDFLKNCLDFQDNGLVPPVEVVIEFYSNEENTPFARDESAMKIMWSNKVVSVYKTRQAVTKLTVLPGPNNEKGMYMRPSMFFSVAQTSQLKEQAGKFLNYFLKDIEANKVLAADRGVPVVPTVRETLKQTADPQNAEIYDYISFAGQHSSDMSTRFPTAEQEIRDLYQYNYFQRVMYKQMTPEAAVKEFREQMTIILNQ